MTKIVQNKTVCSKKSRFLQTNFVNICWAISRKKFCKVILLIAGQFHDFFAFL